MYVGPPFSNCCSHSGPRRACWNEVACLRTKNNSLAKVFYLPLRTRQNMQSFERRGEGALQERENWKGSVMCDWLLHSHSGALSSRVDRAATLVVQGAGLATGGCIRAGAGLLFGLIGCCLLSLGLGDGLSVLLVLVDGPVEDIVILEPLTHKQVAEDLAQVRIVWLVVEAETASVVEVDGELVGEAAAQNLGGRRHLLLHDAVILLLLGGRLKTLPRQATAAEVEHDIAERLHVVAAGLLYRRVSIYRTRDRVLYTYQHPSAC